MRKKPGQWFENEEFWQRFAPVMFDADRWAEAPCIAEYIVRNAALTNGSSVLDAGCGPGRISLALASLGMNVTGVDIIQSELDAAQESADDEGLSITFLNKDLRRFRTKQKFDCAVNLFTSFGYCSTVREDFSILKHIARALKKGGAFIMETTCRETAVLYFTEGEQFERNGLTVTTQFSVEGAWEGLRSNWTLTDRNGGTYSHEFVQRLYSAAELRDMMLRAGFRTATVTGDFDGSPYNQHARTAVITARK